MFRPFIMSRSVEMLRKDISGTERHITNISLYKSIPIYIYIYIYIYIGMCVCVYTTNCNTQSSAPEDG